MMSQNWIGTVLVMLSFSEVAWSDHKLLVFDVMP